MAGSLIYWTRAPASTILVRLAISAVFIVAGTMKFVRPADAGPTRFAEIGIPAPEILNPMVAGFEIICGVLVLVGLLTRLAAIPLVVIMLVAIVTTKLPVLE
jgi:putative oxidoreductase